MQELLVGGNEPRLHGRPLPQRCLGGMGSGIGMGDGVLDDGAVFGTARPDGSPVAIEAVSLQLKKDETTVFIAEC